MDRRDAEAGARVGEDLRARTILDHLAKAADGIAVGEGAAIPIENQRAFMGTWVDGRKLPERR